jgi:Right handed beta helix region
MRMLPSAFNLVLVAVSCLALAPLAHAQASRTWVSGVGDDANPCSRTAPCKTFAGAISKTAPGGEIDALDPGGFGAVTITKAITIDGGAFASVLVSGTNGIVVQAGAVDVVTLRNLSVNGIGSGINGIRFLSGKTLNVENVVISGFTTHGIDVSLTDTATLNVTNTTVRTCGSAGIHLRSNVVAVGSIERSRVHGCGTGVLGDTGTRATVRDSDLSSNTTGVQASVGAEVNIDETLSAYSTTGFLANAGVLRLTNNTVMNDGTGLAVQSGGQIISLGSNSVAGNSVDGSPTSTIAPR